MRETALKRMKRPETDVAGIGSGSFFAVAPLSVQNTAV